jgi:hypothetical protein
MDAGPVCFDTRHQFADGDCPIVFWDHEWVDTEKEIQPMFSNSAAMFRCLLFITQAPLGFFHHDATRDDPALLPKKRELLRQFLNLDPEGAGSAAKDYWTSWGVDVP